MVASEYGALQNTPSPINPIVQESQLRVHFDQWLQEAVPLQVSSPSPAFGPAAVDIELQDVMLAKVLTAEDISEGRLAAARTLVEAQVMEARHRAGVELTGGRGCQGCRL